MRSARETEGVPRSYSEHAKRLLNKTCALRRTLFVAHVVHHPHDESTGFESQNYIYGVASAVLDPTNFHGFISHPVLASAITGETQFCQPITTRFELGGGVQR